MSLPDPLDQLPARPVTVTAGAAMLFAGAVILFLTWVAGIDPVDSNGARVFFVVLWGYLAWGAYSGGGWVRVAIVAIVAVSVWGSFNAPSLASAWQAMALGDLLAKLLAAIALGFMLKAEARRWFASVRELRAQS